MVQVYPSKRVSSNLNYFFENLAALITTKYVGFYPAKTALTQPNIATVLVIKTVLNTHFQINSRSQKAALKSFAFAKSFSTKFIFEKTIVADKI